MARSSDNAPDLGPCCGCATREHVNTIVMLPVRAAVAGHGWGCVVCNLAQDGAYAVLCDPCAARFRDDPARLLIACRGYPGEDGRIPVSELRGPFEHDMRRHHDAGDF